MLDKKVAELINTQVNKEFYSAYLYLDFANYYKDAELNGFSNWYQVQAQEERDHAMLFIQYLQNNGEKITLEPIAKGEEEKNASELVKRFDLFGHDPKGLYMLDSELAARVYTVPSLVL